MTPPGFKIPHHLDPEALWNPPDETIPILVSTHSYLLRFNLSPDDPRDYTLEVLDSAGHFHGMARNEDTFFYVKSVWFSPDDFDDLLASPSYVLNVSPTKDLDNLIFFVDEMLCSAHQLAWADEGLYIVDTGNNRLLWVSYAKERRAEHLFENTAFDVNHPNSVLPLGPKRVAVLLHNRSKRKSEIVFLRREGSQFRRERVVPLLHEECHDMLPVGEQKIAYLASKLGRLVGFDLRSRERLFEVDVGGYAKGLARVGDWFICGASPSVARQHRRDTKGEIVATNLAEETQVRLKPDIDGEPIGNVNDLMVWG